MKVLVKDQDDNIFRVDLIGQLPEGLTIVPEEEMEDSELIKCREEKMVEIRSRRDKMLISHDKQFLIALKESADTTDLLADRTTLLDLPAAAQTDLDAETDLQAIKDYDAFSSLSLNGSYE